MLAVARGQTPLHPRVDALRMRGGHLAQHLPHRIQADPPMSAHSYFPFHAHGFVWAHATAQPVTPEERRGQ